MILFKDALYMDKNNVKLLCSCENTIIFDKNKNYGEYELKNINKNINNIFDYNITLNIFI